MFDNLFKNNLPIENYILSTLKKNKHNLELAYSEIYSKYPFWKKSALKNIISEILKKQINGEKISGIWSRIEKKWQLVPVVNKSSNKIKSDALPWSGAELPAAEDPNSTGNNLGTYSRPSGPPKNKQIPENKYNKDFEEVTEVEIDMDEMQQAYDTIFDKFKSSIKDVDKLNSVILDEMIKKYGSIVVNLKLRVQI